MAGGGGVVVVGAGLAGARTCAELRGAGYTGSLVLVGSERHLPYDRPPLSKAVLAGTESDTTLPTDLTALDVDLRLGCRAVSIADKSLRTEGGAVPFEVLVAATGSAPVTLPGTGPQVTLRTIDDALALRARLRAGTRVVVVGAGWIGAEVATAARGA
ncbi:MAG: FAD-dependent oxidoreductase, partial [Mycobacteriales bacterium]